VRKTTRGKVSLCLRLRPDAARLHEPLQAAKLALRSVAERVRELEVQIRLLDTHLARLVVAAAPRTTSLLGISTGLLPGRALTVLGVRTRSEPSP
jgi:transposase